MIRALKGAGRDEEAITLCEQEAPITSSYCRLVKALIAAKRTQEAEQWIHQGIKATEKSLPGIAAELRHQLLEIRRRLRDTAGVAALSVDEFVRSPGEDTYAACRRAAAKMKTWKQVREGLLDFLETGSLPWTQYVATIRIEHARKRSLLEVLDALEGTPILKGGHERRK